LDFFWLSIMNSTLSWLDVGTVARYFCMPLVSIRVGKNKKQLACSLVIEFT
jgi:hypothetical protein